VRTGFLQHHAYPNGFSGGGGSTPLTHDHTFIRKNPALAIHTGKFGCMETFYPANTLEPKPAYEAQRRRRLRDLAADAVDAPIAGIAYCIRPSGVLC